MSDHSGVNLLDFDHTIYDGDSTLDFYFFCIQNRPFLLVFLPYQVLHAILFFAKLQSRTAFKDRFMVFIRHVPDLEGLVMRFWQEKGSRRVKKWYKERDRSKDVIVSASPDFLLKQVASDLGVMKLIATRVDLSSGRIIGHNCYGSEKVRRIHEEMANESINETFSDHVSDEPLLQLGREAFIVKGETLTRYRPKS